jgi:homoaconitate hydratase
LDALFANPISANKGAACTKTLSLSLSSLSPHDAGPYSVQVATPLVDLEAQNMTTHRAYLVCYTNSSQSDIAAAAKVFKDAAEASGDVISRIPNHVNSYIAAAYLSE